MLIQLAHVSQFLIWDEPVYLGNAKSHIGESHFTEDFRFPLLEYVISLSWTVFGESVLIAKYVAIFFTLLSVFGFYLLP